MAKGSKKIKYERTETMVMDDGSIVEVDLDLFRENARYRWFNLDMELIAEGEVPVEIDGMDREMFVVNEMGDKGRALYLEDFTNSEE